MSNRLVAFGISRPWTYQLDVDRGEDVIDDAENRKKGHGDGHQKDGEANFTVRKMFIELLEEIYTVRMRS